MKGNRIALNLLYLILILSVLFSCQKTKYQWEPGISAPKYYPVGDVKVNFGNAGYGTLTNFENGWGKEYGGVVSGDKYKEIPKDVFIHYSSAAENYTYEGKVNLPQKKILDLFRKYKINDVNFAHLVVGMAPGGWVRIWFTTVDKQIEVAKAKLKGHYDTTLGGGFKNKNSQYWRKYKIYWQHHGIPYGAWANNEKEYYYDIKFVTQNKNAKLDRSYVVSADGWYSSFYTEKLSEDINDVSNNGSTGKIPVHLSVSWQDKSSGMYYDTNIVMPKTLKRLFDETYQANEKLAYSNFIIELENDKQHAVVYLKTKNKVIKLLRFKGEISSKDKQDFGDYAYAEEIECFIP